MDTLFGKLFLYICQRASQRTSPLKKFYILFLEKGCPSCPTGVKNSRISRLDWTPPLVHRVSKLSTGLSWGEGFYGSLRSPRELGVPQKPKNDFLPSGIVEGRWRSFGNPRTVWSPLESCGNLEVLPLASLSSISSGRR